MSNGFNNLASYGANPSPALEDAPPIECKRLHIAGAHDRSMRHVLFIIDELCEMGGAERTLLKMVRLLPEYGLRGSVLTFNVEEEVDEIKNISCPLHVLPLKKTYGWNALKVAMQIRRLIREQDVSIVHTFFETSDLWAGPIARLSGCPVLISSRRDLGILRSFKHRIGYKVFGGIYDAVLAVSPQVREFCIRQDGLDPGKVRTVFNGVEIENVSSSPGRRAMRWKLGIAEDIPVITTVGNIRRVKGMDVLVQAGAMVCSKHPDALFLVVGRKSEPEHCRELEKSISELGLGANFRFLGSTDAFPILGMSDIFCLPSRSEGFSNALIEAMAFGLPCVATDVGGNREVLQDGSTGFIAPSDDPKALAQSLISLLDDPALAARMGRKGREVVELGFTSEAMMQNIVDIYDELLRARKVR